MKNLTLTLLVIACAVAIATPAMAQNAAPQTNASWRGQDNEFGSIRAPYTVDMEGEEVPIQAQVFIRDLYTEKDGRFYMFTFTVENTPLTVKLDQIVRADTGEELPCYQRADAAGQAKCTIDLKHMPPENTEILMHGRVGSGKVGTFNVGAMVMPFTATWFKIAMSNGLDAELYAGTAVNVKTATHGSNSLAGAGNVIPGAGGLGAIAALATAAAVGTSLVARRRRE